MTCKKCHQKQEKATNNREAMRGNVALNARGKVRLLLLSGRFVRITRLSDKSRQLNNRAFLKI